MKTGEQRGKATDLLQKQMGETPRLHKSVNRGHTASNSQLKGNPELEERGGIGPKCKPHKTQTKDLLNSIKGAQDRPTTIGKVKLT